MTGYNANRIGDEFLYSVDELVDRVNRELKQNPVIKSKNAAAWLLGISESTLRRYIRSNSIPIGYRRLLLTVLTGVPLTWSKDWAEHRFCARTGALIDPTGGTWSPGDLRVYRYRMQQLDALERQKKSGEQLTWVAAQQAFSRWQVPQGGPGRAWSSAQHDVYAAVRDALRDEISAQRLQCF